MLVMNKSLMRFFIEKVIIGDLSVALSYPAFELTITTVLRSHENEVLHHWASGDCGAIVCWLCESGNRPLSRGM